MHKPSKLHPGLQPRWFMVHVRNLQMWAGVGPSPGADVTTVSPVPVQTWQRRAHLQHTVLRQPRHPQRRLGKPLAVVSAVHPPAAGALPRERDERRRDAPLLAHAQVERVPAKRNEGVHSRSVASATDPEHAHAVRIAAAAPGNRYVPRSGTAGATIDSNGPRIVVVVVRWRNAGLVSRLQWQHLLTRLRRGRGGPSPGCG
jgi:hypothetical protein